MSSFLRDAEDALVDRTADSVANDFIPGGSGFIGGAVQTGVDQALNNDINSDLSGGFGSGGGGGGGIF